MLNNYFTLRHLAVHLNGLLSQRRIAEMYSQTRDTVVVSFHDSAESLIISCRPDRNVIYLHPRFTRAATNTADVLRSCRGLLIHSLSLHPADRILTIAFEGNLSLHMHFFGSAANLFLVDEHNRILDTFKNSKKFAGTGYEPVTPPPAAATASLHDALMLTPSARIDIVLKDAFPHFGAPVVREVLFRSHISPLLTPAEISPEDIGRLGQVIRLIVTELETPKPRIYALDSDVNVSPDGHGKDGRSGLFSIIRLEHLHGYRERSFDDIHEAIRVFIADCESTSGLDHRRNALLGPLVRYIGRAERTVQALEQDLAGNNRPDQCEHFGSLLMTHLTAIRKGASSVALGDGDSMSEVPLDPSLTPLENAQRYFAKAKRSRTAQQEARQRLDQLTSNLLEARRLRSAISTIADKKELRDFMNLHETELARFGIGAKNSARERLPFRVFTVEGGFEVFAGKSSENNDLLTMKHTKPNDLWFHARGSSGSHVVLRVGTGRGEPSKRAKEQAASIAAYYSKMRNAKLVPVAMTERKFVRKPRGSPPGTVLLEREKVIFVEPSLPQP